MVSLMAMSAKPERVSAVEQCVGASSFHCSSFDDDAEWQEALRLQSEATTSMPRLKQLA